MEKIIPPTVDEGDRNVTERIDLVIDDLLTMVKSQSEGNESARLERLKKVESKRKNCLDKLKWLKKLNYRKKSN